MYVRAALLLAVFQEALGGGGGTLQLIKFRPDAITADQLGADDDHSACGVNVTPDYIQGCVYTDCFTSYTYTPADGSTAAKWTKGDQSLQWLTNSDNDDTTSFDEGAKSSRRRRLGDSFSPYAYKGLDDYTTDEIPDCTVKPTAGSHWELDNAAAAPASVTDCPAGDKKIPIDTLGDVAGEVPGKNVCSYAEARPRYKDPATGNTEYCLCKTVRCQVAALEDKEITAAGDAQKYGHCNFNVRVETAHSVPYVPAYWMWIIFGFSLFVAAMTSAFFICMYGSASHHHKHGEGGEGGGHEHGKKEPTDE